MTTPALSLIVPAFNEERRIAYTIEKTGDYLVKRYSPGDFEVIVVDDGSSDTTAKVVADLCKTRPWLQILTGEPNRGKGYATRRGIMASKGKVIGFMDADYKTPIEELEKLVPLVEKDIDFAIGSRNDARAVIEVAQPFHRRIGSRAFGFVMHFLIGIKEIGDTQCGFKFLKRDVALDLFRRQEIDGYMFDVEVIAFAVRARYRIAQVPIRWHNDADSRYNPLLHTVKLGMDLLRIRKSLRKQPVAAADTRARQFA